jgi:hypothetical protein
MRLTLARARFLAALGLPIAAVAACTPGWPTPAKTTHTGAWDPNLPGPEADGRPRCPSGEFCVPAPAAVDGAAAPAPFQACSATVPLPQGIGPRRQEGIDVSFWQELTTHERQGDPAACCYSWVNPCPGGRPLRGTGADVVADTVSRDGWTGKSGESAASVAVDSVPVPERARLAARWAREAAFEHASIASFGRAALALLAHGAPADLVARAHEAALDEVEHARIAYALSSLYSGEHRGPGPLPLGDMAPLPSSLADLAVETFLDGCVNETVAALTLAETADRTADSALCALLRRVAADEERHAELGWVTVGWALRAGGAEVTAALAQAVSKIEAELAAPPPAAVDGDPGYPAHGVPSASAAAAMRRATLAQVILPCAGALLASATRTHRAAEGPRPSANS